MGGAVNYATYNSAILLGPLDPKKAEIYTANGYLFAQGVSEVPGLQVQPDRKGLPIWGTQVCWRACRWVEWRAFMGMHSRLALHSTARALLRQGPLCAHRLQQRRLDQVSIETTKLHLQSSSHPASRFHLTLYHGTYTIITQSSNTITQAAPYGVQGPAPAEGVAVHALLRRPCAEPGAGHAAADAPGAHLIAVCWELGAGWGMK